LGFKAWLLDTNLRCLSLKSVNDGQIILRGWLLVMGVGYVVLEEEKEGVFSR
jgi:hypothetical protein